MQTNILKLLLIVAAFNVGTGLYAGRGEEGSAGKSISIGAAFTFLFRSGYDYVVGNDGNREIQVVDESSDSGESDSGESDSEGHEDADSGDEGSPVVEVVIVGGVIQPLGDFHQIQLIEEEVFPVASPAAVTGMTLEQLLFEAVQAGDIPGVQTLLENELLNPNAIDQYGCTPLSYAARNGQLEIVESLLADVRVDPNVHGLNQDTPLGFAVEKEHVEIVEKLLADERIDPNVRGKQASIASGSS